MQELPSSIAETHVSVVFFVGERAYKLKKPVRTGFLDFSTREAREAVCHREVELNRRLAPDVYLGVADIHDTEGQVCDHLVVMRRMPPERRLSALLREGDDVDTCLRRVARAVAHFHSAAPTSPEIATAGAVDAVRQMWEDNFSEMAPHVGSVLDRELADRMQTLAGRYLDGREPLFRRRIEDGRVRDGHGDLLSDDIFCLDDGPRILDCIEFDDRLRYGDVLADVAFLTMDLERLGYPDAATRFLELYRDMSGETYPGTLAHHYIAYRAQVRSKVACLRHEQGDTDEAASQAQQLLRLGVEHLERGRVRLVLVGGLPGTGKTTLANLLADELGWATLHSDTVRKELAGIPHDEAAGAAYGEGIYRAEMTEVTYTELLDRAHRLLSLGESVILDASWVRHDHRRRAAEVAEATASDLVPIACIAPREVTADRMRRRAEAGTDASDATDVVAARLAEDADPWPEASEIDTAVSVDTALSAAVRAVEA